MQIIADLHLHSKYSRAVSQKMNLVEIDSWAKKKGINLVAIPDWTHPLFFREIKNSLQETSPGIFSLKNSPVKFIFATEISSIYSQGGKVRRIHNSIFSPSIKTAEKIIKEFEKRGFNIMSDGRPIIGLSARGLLELVLGIDKNCLFVPCHIWTPWFSVFGSKSGFDSLAECFGNLSNEIYAIETGLSSDPIMNWQIKELESRTIISSSDAHSGPKLGREATVFVENSKSQIPNPKLSSNFKFPFQDKQISNFSYTDIIDAIKQKPNGKLKIGYTIEFFPEEGKYHWSGHRACNIRYTPKQVKEKGLICPKCKKPLTIGVENRVIDLSEKVLDKKNLLFIKNKAGVTFVYDKQKKRCPFVSLIPLLEVLLEISHSPTKAAAEYERLIKEFAPEFDILLRKSYTEIEKAGGQKLKLAVKTIRDRRVFVDPGYDGVFGKVKIFPENNITKENKQSSENQPSLF